MADAGSVASVGFHAEATRVMDRVKPEGFNGLTLVSSKSAVGEAVKDAMTQRAVNTDEEGWAALRFSGSTHGSPLTLGGMICGWPEVAYPDSKESESQILEQVRSTLSDRHGSGKPIAAVVIEPTQATTGKTASADFLRTLRNICDDFETALVIDETNTCLGASGNGFWQSDSDVKADYLAFGKRTQVTGFFSKAEGDVLGGYENDLKLFNAIYDGVEADGLLDHAKKTTSTVADHASSVSGNGITGVRSSGTSVWIHTDSPKTATELAAHLRTNGVLVQPNGSGVVARPTLLFGDQQARELMDALKSF